VANEPSDVPTRTAVLERRADATDRTLESLRNDVNRGFGELRGEFRPSARGQRALRSHGRPHGSAHLRWIITTVITMAVAIVGANVGILTLLLRAR